MVHKEIEKGNSHKTQPKQHKQGQRSRNTGSVDAYNKKNIETNDAQKNQQTPEEAMVHGNNSRIEMHQSQQTTMIYKAVPEPVDVIA